MHQVTLHLIAREKDLCHFPDPGSQLPAIRGLPWHVDASVWSLPPSSHGVHPCVSSMPLFPNLPLLSLRKASGTRLRTCATPDLNLMTFTKTLFPNKVIFTGTGWGAVRT